MTIKLHTTLSVVICAACFLLGGLPQAATAARGRPVVQGDTLVADNGRLLRGSRWALDVNATIPPSFRYDTLKNTGMNTLHVYAESFAEARCRGLAAGHRASLLDQMVNTADSKGIYLVITIGNGSSLNGNGDPNCNSANGAFDEVYATAFWNFYASRYKDRTHVVYEIQNEPYYDGVNSHPSPSSVRSFEQTMYNLIRSQAPQTPILLYSYAVFNIGSEIVSDLNTLSGIDWSKAAVAFHGYGGLSGTGSALSYVTSRGYPVVQTEFFVFPNNVQQPDVGQTDLYERTRVSWLTFVDLPLVGVPVNFRNPLDQAEIIWSADFGTWPATSNPPVGGFVSLHTPAPYNRIVQADLAVSSTSAPLVADSAMISSWEEFDVLNVDGYHVSLRSRANGRYVAPNGSDQLLAKSTVPWSFEWLNRADGQIALRAQYNNRFVRADHKLPRSKLVASQSKGGGALEGFELVSPCLPGFDTLCFSEGRFEVTATWLNQWNQVGGVAHATPHPTSDVTGFFWFFDAPNLEVGVKVLDGSSINPYFWVFHGAMTTFHYTLNVRDTYTGTVKIYNKATSDLCGGADTTAFPQFATYGEPPFEKLAVPFDALPLKGVGVVAGGTCVDGPKHFCLLNNRFKVQVRQGGSFKNTLRLSNQAGDAWFFSPENREVFVKMFDGTPFNGYFWVFFGSLTDVPFQVLVTDTTNGVTKTYGPPAPNCGVVDTGAF